MRERFINRLVLRVNFGVHQARAPALVIFGNKLNFTSNKLTISAHRIAQWIPLLVITIFVDVVGIAVIGPAHIGTCIMRFHIPVNRILTPAVVSFNPAKKHIRRW